MPPGALCSSTGVREPRTATCRSESGALFWVQLYVGLVRPLFALDQDLDVLFLSSVGTPICADWLCRKVRAYLCQAGIHKRGSCHLLRHSVATLMLEGGADIRYVAEMLGHARLETTQRYTRVSIERLRTVHARCHPASGLDVANAVQQGRIRSQQWTRPMLTRRLLRPRC